MKLRSARSSDSWTSAPYAYAAVSSPGARPESSTVDACRLDAARRDGRARRLAAQAEQ